MSTPKCTLTVEVGGTKFIMYNFTPELIRELRNDPIKLSRHFTNCRDTYTNICVLQDCQDSPTMLDDIHYSNSVLLDSENTPSTSAASIEKEQKFQFLCGSIEGQRYVFGVKFDDHPWHYFDDYDSIRSEHSSLPRSIDKAIDRMVSGVVGTTTLSMSNTLARLYFDDGKFKFKDKELKTYLSFTGELNASKSKPKKQLVLVPGQTNPLFFLNDIVKEFKNDKEKMYEMLRFVKDSDKGEFTELYFTDNWQSFQSKFLTLYTPGYLQNMRKGLNIDFNGETDLRSFVEAKLKSLSTYTTLPFLNQVEMVMNDLPVEISSQFIVNGKMTGNKVEILTYCETIQNLAVHFLKKKQSTEIETECDERSLEMFENIGSTSPYRGRKRGAKRGVRGRGKRGGPLNSIAEEIGSDESYSFLELMDNSSRSSFSDGSTI